MTKQEEIREGIKPILIELRNMAIGLHKIDVEPYLKRIQEFEDSQGVVIKVDRELTVGNVTLYSKAEIMALNIFAEAGYVAVEPLIKEVNK